MGVRRVEFNLDFCMCMQRADIYPCMEGCDVRGCADHYGNSWRD